MKLFPNESNNPAVRLAPITYWGIVVFFDWAEPCGTVTAPLLTIGLLIFSTFLNARWMFIWASMYVLTVYMVLYIPSVSSLVNDGHSVTDTFQRNFRFAGFISVAVFACYFSYMLGRLRAHYRSLQHLVKSLPLPVIVSDSEGRILMLNNETRNLMKINNTQAVESLNYFELLAPESHQGKCIAEYIQALDHDNGSGVTIELEHDGQCLTGHLQILEGKKREIITIITPASASRNSAQPNPLS